jgi:hypothetical protein
MVVRSQSQRKIGEMQHVSIYIYQRGELWFAYASYTVTNGFEESYTHDGTNDAQSYERYLNEHQESFDYTQRFLRIGMVLLMLNLYWWVLEWIGQLMRYQVGTPRWITTKSWARAIALEALALVDLPLGREALNSHICSASMPTVAVGKSNLEWNWAGLAAYVSHAHFPRWVNSYYRLYTKCHKEKMIRIMVEVPMFQRSIPPGSPLRSAQANCKIFAACFRAPMPSKFWSFGWCSPAR